MKKVWLFLIMLCILASYAYAADFSVNATIVNNKIDLNESAEFIISITNNGKDDEFRVRNMAHPFWDIYTKPFANPILVEVEKNTTKEVRILVRPVHITAVDTYYVNIKVESESTGESVEIPLKVGIKSTDILIGGYVPTVLVNLNMLKSIDPRDEVILSINLNNQNLLDYPELKVVVDSNLIKEESIVELGPKEEKTIEIKKQLDPLTKPQEDTLTITLFRDDRVIERVIAKYETEEYFDKVETLDKGFLKTVRKIEVTSNNPDYKGIVKLGTTFVKKMFTSTSPKADVVLEDNMKYFTWNVQLNEEGKMEIKITENYIVLVIISIILIMLVILYLSLRSPMIVTKYSTSIKKKEGGISELSVRINVKNRSKESIKDIDISERIPSIVEIDKEVSIGSLKPSKVMRHENRGSVMKWNVNELDSGEERVITYKIKSKLAILGELNLPAAKVRFHYKGKSNTVRSNRLSISP